MHDPPVPRGTGETQYFASGDSQGKVRKSTNLYFARIHDPPVPRGTGEAQYFAFGDSQSKVRKSKNLYFAKIHDPPVPQGTWGNPVLCLWRQPRQIAKIQESVLCENP